MIVDRWYVQHAAIWHWYLPLCIDIILFNFLLFLTDAYYKVTNLLLINQTKVHDTSMSQLCVCVFLFCFCFLFLKG